MSVTSEMLATEIDKVVNKYIDSAHDAGIELTRDDVIGVITKRLQEIIKGLDLDDERVWVASGMAVGIATVLTIEMKLSEQK